MDSSETSPNDERPYLLFDEDYFAFEQDQADHVFDNLPSETLAAYQFGVLLGMAPSIPLLLEAIAGEYDDDYDLTIIDNLASRDVTIVNLSRSDWEDLENLEDEADEST